MSMQELAAAWDDQNIRQTAYLIEVDGRVISLIRAVEEDDGAGGTILSDPTPLPGVRRFFGSVSEDTREANTIPGTTITADYILIGMPGDVIKDEDEFMIGDRNFVVKWVDPNQDYQVKALVVTHA